MEVNFSDVIIMNSGQYYVELLHLEERILATRIQFTTFEEDLS